MRGQFVKENSTPNWFYWLMGAILTVVFLKGFGILTPLTGIDPVGFSLTIDAGTVGLGLGVAALLVQNQRALSAINARAEAVEDRIDTLESRIESVEKQRLPPWGR